MDSLSEPTLPDLVAQLVVILELPLRRLVISTDHRGDAQAFFGTHQGVMRHHGKTLTISTLWSWLLD